MFARKASTISNELTIERADLFVAITGVFADVGRGKRACYLFYRSCCRRR
jgi:hypothetical protein